MLLVIGGCCLTVVSGSDENDAGSMTSGAACVPGPASDLQTYASYGSNALGAAASGDLNGDGLLDFVAVQTSLMGGGLVYVFFGQPDGGLSAPVTYEGSDDFALALGDLNGDGWLDLAVSNDNEIDILMNNGAGAFSLSTSLATPGAGVTGIGIGDFNSDGFGDVVVSEYFSSPSAPLSYDAKLFLNEGSGNFGAAIPLPGVGGTLYQGLAVGDLNQDGLPDIAAASSDQDAGGLVVLINRGDGGFQTTFYPTVPSLYGQVVLLPHEGAAPDLILGRVEGVGGLEVLKNSGHGTFPTGDFYPIPGGISIAVGDFNGDCIPDVATSSFGGCEVGDGFALSVLYGAADGGFGPVESLDAGGRTLGGLAA